MNIYIVKKQVTKNMLNERVILQLFIYYEREYDRNWLIDCQLSNILNYDNEL